MMQDDRQLDQSTDSFWHHINSALDLFRLDDGLHPVQGHLGPVLFLLWNICEDECLASLLCFPIMNSCSFTQWLTTLEEMFILSWMHMQGNETCNSFTLYKMEGEMEKGILYILYTVVPIVHLIESMSLFSSQDSWMSCDHSDCN